MENRCRAVPQWYWCAAATLALSLSFTASPVAAQSEAMRFVSIDGRSVAYHVVGGGPQAPLVLLNGGPGYDHQYFHMTTVWDRLGQTRAVVFIDQPGTGQSYPVRRGDPVTVRDILNAIRVVLDTLGADRAALLGHSWGGYLAMAFAVECPRRTEQVILIGTAAPNWTGTEFNFAPLFPDSLARGASSPSDSSGATKDLRRHLAMSFYSPVIRDRALSGFTGLPRNAWQSQQLREDASRNDLSVRLSDLTVPVLVGTGRFDANVAPRTSWRVHSLIPHSRFFVWEQSGHYPMVEQPDEFVDVVDRFLAQAHSRDRAGYCGI